MSDDLTELVDAEIFVEGAATPTDEQRLLKTLEGQKGIAELSITQGRLDIRYDPISITKDDIAHRVQAAGFRIKEVETAASSPVTDTLPPTAPPETAAGSDSPEQ